MRGKAPDPFVGTKKACILLGVLPVIPLLITWWAVRFILSLLKDCGGPAVTWLRLVLRPWSPEAADLLVHPWFESVLAVFLALPGFYLLGWSATRADAATGRPLAAVYVPTTPNPTSGCLEIVPLDRVISRHWTMDEAMAFIMSGGAVALPARRYYPEKEVPPPERREEAPGAENRPQEGEKP